MKKIIIAVLALTVLSGCQTTPTHTPPRVNDASPSATTTAGATDLVDTSPVDAKVSDVVVKGHPFFGLSVVNNVTDLNRIGRAVGCYPQSVAIFTSVPLGLYVEQFEAIPGIPFVTIQPWDYKQSSQYYQANYELQDTLDGKHDNAYHSMAKAVAKYRQVILVRLMHEMNGFWYPWGNVGNNTPAQYREAWRHIVRIFRQEGATNALFVWSPNVVRFLDDKNIAQYYPGDSWVDFAGMVGYGKDEASAYETYRETLRRIYDLTDKPIIVTETGSDGTNKPEWIESFGRWLRDNPRVAGFIWTDKPKGNLANGNWGMTTDKSSIAAFKKAMKTAGVIC